MKRLSVFFSIIASLFLFTVVLSTTHASEEATEEVPHVSFAMFELDNPGTWYTLVPVAKMAGMFEKHGVHVELTNHGSMANLRNAVLRGDDQFFLEVFPLKDMPQEFVSHAALSTRMTLNVVVRKDSGIDSIADLGGNTISSLGCGEKLGITARMLRDAVEDVGLQFACSEGGRPDEPDPDTVYITPGGSVGYVQLLRNDTVDGTATMFVDALQLLEEGDYQIVASSSKTMQAGRIFTYTQLSTERSWAQENPEAVSRVINALIETREKMWNYEWAEPYLAKYVLHKPLERATRSERIMLARFYSTFQDITPQYLCIPEWVARESIRYYADNPDLNLEGTVRFKHCPR